MDLLRTAYSPASDDDDDDVGEEHGRPSQPSPPKRPRLNFYAQFPAKPFLPPILPTETLITGRYISKRERAALAAVTTSPESTSHTTVSISSGQKNKAYSMTKALPLDTFEKLRKSMGLLMLN